ncbi:hypothetical protein KJ616_00760 [Patescibacteria group bacterium]|nr:hypothetical protein [Patescibacteria group bacterium]
MRYKNTKIAIVSLLFFFALGGIASAQESCASLYEQHGTIINRYDSDQNGKISLQESDAAVSAWFEYAWTDNDLLGLLKFARQGCVIPSLENDPVSGTLSASAIQVNIGETIVLTVTGKDNDGLQNLWAYYQGSWHNKPVQGEAADTTFTFSESKAGTYVYKGYIYGSQPTGVKETAWTTPQEVRVEVLPATVVDCHYYYWFDDDTPACGYKQFCGAYVYYGLRTFATQQECEEALPETPSENNLVSGTLSVSAAQVSPGDDITLTVTGQDNDGLYALLVYYQGQWYKKLVQGTTASATFTFSESQPGVYTYFGYVYGKTPGGNLEFNWTEPKIVTVKVQSSQVAGGPDLIISSVSTSPSSLTIADDVDFKVTIKNIGTQQLPVVSSGIITKVSSSSMEGSGWRICDAMTTQLKVGESATIDCPIVQRLSKGSHNFTFLVDSSYRLAEGNENNNEFSKTVSVGGGTIVNNDVVSGTFAASAANVNVGQSFTLTIIAQDDQGVEKIKMYYKGAWRTFDCGGQTSCTKSSDLYESTAGTYTYYAIVYGYDLNGNSENNNTSPPSMRVVVKQAGNCAETDGGKDYYTKGTTTNIITDGGLSLSSWTDICLKDNQTALAGQENYLFEAYCDDNGIGRLMSGPTAYICPKGCQNGVCIK